MKPDTVTSATADREMHRHQVGRRLEMIRRAMGYETIKAFADFLDIHEDSISLIEGGRRRLNIIQLAKIKKETGYTTDFLIADDRSGLTDDQKRALKKIEKLVL